MVWFGLRLKVLVSKNWVLGSIFFLILFLEYANLKLQSFELELWNVGWDGHQHGKLNVDIIRFVHSYIFIVFVFFFWLPVIRVEKIDIE